MKMDLAQGDSFERTNAQWIRENLPTYETLWSSFIGNDGTAHPLKLIDLPPKMEEARRRFYQAHYSMAQSAKKVSEILGSLEAECCSGSNVDRHRQFDLLFCFMSRIGHVRDMVEIMGNAIGMNRAREKLQEFYDQRSHLTHGPQMPFEVKSDILYVPIIAGRNPLESQWSKEKAWEKMDPAKFIPLYDLCERTKNEFFEVLNSVHEAIHSKACEFFSGYTLATPKLQMNLDTGSDSLSGSSASGRYWSSQTT